MPVVRSRSVPAPLLVIGAILSVQVGAAIATGLIRDLGPLVTVTIRLDVAALVLLVIARPSPRGRSRRDWGLVGLLGLSLVVMNVTFYNAIARLPLGVVTTIEFLGPLALAAAASRRPRDLLAVAVALAGVVAVSGALTASWQDLDALGLAFTIAAGVSWAAYILTMRGVGSRWSEVDGLAASMLLAAALITPFGVIAAQGITITAAQLAAGAFVAVLSSVVPYSFELFALRRIDNRVFGILLSLEPAASALVGFFLLGQALAAPQVVGIGLVVAASAIVLAFQDAPPQVEAAEIG